MNLFKLLLTFTSVLISNAYKWHDCGDSNSRVHWEYVNISEPLRLNDMRISAKWTIVEEIPQGSNSKIEVWRVSRVPLLVPIHIKIPCINNMGSCDYDFCRKADNDNFCLFQEDAAHTTCGCPMTPKTVEGYNYRIKGYYKARWTWFEPNGAKIGCVEAEAYLSS